LSQVVKLLANAMVNRSVGINQICVDGKNAAFFAAFRGKTKLLQFLASKVRLILLSVWCVSVSE
jgi:hypothetical protein